MLLPATTQPDLGDVSSLINKFKNAPGAPIKARALLAPNDAFGNFTNSTLSIDIGFAHIAATVDGFKGQPYPAKMGKCAGSSFACTVNLECGANGPCNLYCP